MVFWGMAAYRQGLHQELIKHHRLWSSDSFWAYINSPCVASSPVAAGLTRAVQATSTISTPLPISPNPIPLLPPSPSPQTPHLQLHVDECTSPQLLKYKSDGCQCPQVSVHWHIWILVLLLLLDSAFIVQGFTQGTFDTFPLLWYSQDTLWLNRPQTVDVCI